MCYSAQIKAEFREYVRAYGAKIDLQEYVRFFWHRSQGENLKVPRAIEQDFLRAEAGTGQGQEIQRLIREHDAGNIATWEAEIFKQRKRLADAERALATKVTKKAGNDMRVATKKIDQLLGWLGNVKRTETKPRDARIYPGWYAPVIVWENGQRVVKPMRYQCRPAGRPASYDTRYPGTYNARRDNLEGFWKDLWGYQHGVMLATSFFENVERVSDDGQPRNAVVEFRPNGVETMLVACLWSEWQQGDERLLSFAAITDEPPAEVMAAGHDRCIVPIREANLDAWLQPDRANLAASMAILDDRERPYYEHRMAA